VGFGLQDCVYGVYRGEVRLQLCCEGGDAGDGVFGAEEEAKSCSVVDAAVEQEAALVGGVFAPFGFCTSRLMKRQGLGRGGETCCNTSRQVLSSNTL